MVKGSGCHFSGWPVKKSKRCGPVVRVYDTESSIGQVKVCQRHESLIRSIAEEARVKAGKGLCAA